MKKRIWIGFMPIVLMLALSMSGCVKEEFKLTPEENVGENGTTEVLGTEVSTGWSVNESPEKAVTEAVDMALSNKIDKTPDFAIMFASSGSDLDAILSKARELLGNETKIYGGTSDSRAVMTEKGFVKVTERGYEQSLMEGKRGLVIMTITSEDIEFGVGSANYSSYSSVKEAARVAIVAAIENAGKNQSESPNVVLTLPTIGLEDDALAGIEEIIGNNTPILGGTAGGPTFSVFGENETYSEGISLAIMYTDLPVGVMFEGGFDTTGEYSGIVTKADGQAIVEIDNRPALDVYNEWLDGEIDRIYDEIGEPDVIRDLLTLHPFYRKYTTSDGTIYRLFSHPWPKDETLVNRSVMTSTNIEAGERIYLSSGTWETLLNRIGNAPKNAKINGGINVDSKPLFGIGIVCGGVMGVIPEEEREKMLVLINYENKNAPFIASFTWGEQGFYPGLGNRHCNLQTGFIVIGEKEVG